MFLLKTATYLIEIRNFRRKLGMAQRGDEVSTEKFFVNWSEFSIDLVFVGEDEDEDVDDDCYLGLFLTNHSDWMVRADSEVTVKGEILSSLASPGRVLKSRDADFSDRSWGQPGCVPLSRCYNNDLLSHGGLTIEVKVKVYAEKTSEGAGDSQRQLSALKEELSDLQGQLAILEQASVSKGEMSGVKRKIVDQDTELEDLKKKNRK